MCEEYRYLSKSKHGIVSPICALLNINASFYIFDKLSNVFKLQHNIALSS